MAEKNTHSILETIKKKLHNFDQKSEKAAQISDVAGEFEYIAPATETESEESKINPSESSEKQEFSEDEFPSQPSDLEVTTDLNLNDESDLSIVREEEFTKDDVEDYEDEVEIAEEEVVEAEAVADEVEEDDSGEEVISQDQSPEEKTTITESDLYHDDEPLKLEEEVSQEIPAIAAEQEVFEQPLPDIEHDDLNFDDLELDDEQEQNVLPLKQPEKQIQNVIPQFVSQSIPQEISLPQEELIDDIDLDSLERELEEKKAQQQQNKNQIHDEIDLEFEKELMEVKSKNSKTFEIAQPVASKEKVEQKDQQEFFTPVQISTVDMAIDQNKSGSKILSDNTIMQTTESIKKLLDAKKVVSGISAFSQSPALAELAIQLMEPKMEKWLNENLADLVEKIVREEIKKIVPHE